MTPVAKKEKEKDIIQMSKKKFLALWRQWRVYRMKEYACGGFGNLVLAKKKDFLLLSVSQAAF